MLQLKLYIQTRELTIYPLLTVYDLPLKYGIPLKCPGNKRYAGAGLRFKDAYLCMITLSIIIPSYFCVRLRSNDFLNSFFVRNTVSKMPTVVSKFFDRPETQVM